MPAPTDCPGDGAHSKVRKSIPEARPVGLSHPSVWGVLDGELITDFPDIWSKTLVYSQEHGSILIIPRERNMTRFYIELKSSPKGDRNQLGQEFVMQRAKDIMAPFEIGWKYIEWFGRYQIGQRVASRFGDNHLRAFLAGDASHTHSPKAAQGMNTSMHDAWNIGWKLNFSVRGLAKEALLQSYEEERRKIALDLVNFDYEHANQIAGGDAHALAENFKTNVRFISGIGAEYSENAINMVEAQSWVMGEAKPGCLLPPAKVTRYLDSNPVDIQLDIPMLGQFRIYLLMWDVHQSRIFLDTFCHAIAQPDSLVSQLSAAAAVSYAKQPRLPAPEDIYLRPERYTAVSHLFTFGLISTSPNPLTLRREKLTFSQPRCPRATLKSLISPRCSRTAAGPFTSTTSPSRTRAARCAPTSGSAAWGRARWRLSMCGRTATSGPLAGGTRALMMPARRRPSGWTCIMTGSCRFRQGRRFEPFKDGGGSISCHVFGDLAGLKGRERKRGNVDHVSVWTSGGEGRTCMKKDGTNRGRTRGRHSQPTRDTRHTHTIVHAERREEEGAGAAWRSFEIMTFDDGKGLYIRTRDDIRWGFFA